MLLLKSVTEDLDRSMVLRKDPTYIHFHYAYGFATQKLADMLDSLVRVSRRVTESHYANILSAKVPEGLPLRGRCDPRSPATYPVQGYNTSGEATFPIPLSVAENRCWPAKQ